MIGTDFLQQRAHTIAHTERFTGNQVFTGQQGFGIGPQIHDDVVTCHFLYGAGDEFTHAIPVAVDNLGALGFPHFLEYDLFRCLGTNTAEGNGFHFLFVDIAGLKTLVDVFRFLHGQLGAQGRNRIVINHQPATERFIFAGAAIDGNANVRFLVVVAFFGSGGECQLDCFEDHVLLDTFLVRDGFNHQQDLFTHWIALPLKINFASTDLLKYRNDVGFLDAIEWQQVFVIINNHDNVFTFNAFNQALKLATPLKCHS